jgi:hypothetical protein
MIISMMKMLVLHAVNYMEMKEYSVGFKLNIVIMIISGLMISAVLEMR